MKSLFNTLYKTLLNVTVAVYFVLYSGLAVAFFWLMVDNPSVETLAMTLVVAFLFRNYLMMDVSLRSFKKRMAVMANA